MLSYLLLVGEEEVVGEEVGGVVVVVGGVVGVVGEVVGVVEVMLVRLVRVEPLPSLGMLEMDKRERWLLWLAVGVCWCFDLAQCGVNYRDDTVICNTNNNSTHTHPFTFTHTPYYHGIEAQ